MQFIDKKIRIIFLLALSVLFFQCDDERDVLVTISTRFGDIHLVLFDETPEHKKNFLKLANEKFYDSMTFHRVIDAFIVQAGDPNSKPKGDSRMVGMGGPGYTVPAEIKPEFKHIRGAVAAARQGDDVNPERRSSGSQFYIVQSTSGTPHLNGLYTVFGQVISGMDVVDQIASQQVGAGARPIENIYLAVTLKLMKRKDITKKYGYQYKKEEKKDKAS